MDEPVPPTPRLPYSPPRLRVYGRVREMTLTSGATVGPNDMGGGKDKTGFS